MKYIQALVNERFARSAAKLLTYACYFLIGFFALCTFLSFIGRQTFILHTSTKTFDHAIYRSDRSFSHVRRPYRSHHAGLLVFKPCVLQRLPRTYFHKSKCFLPALLWPASMFHGLVCPVCETSDLLDYQLFVGEPGPSFHRTNDAQYHRPQHRRSRRRVYPPLRCAFAG